MQKETNIFRQSRDKAGLTRAEASELLNIADSRIERIEYDKTTPHLDEVRDMAKCYKDPDLCARFCSSVCDIGKSLGMKYESGTDKQLSQIVLQILKSVNALNREKDRLIEITADGIIDNSELKDFAEIKNELDSIADSVASLQKWVNSISPEVLDKDKLNEIKEKA